MAELQNTVINGTLQIEKRAQMTPLAASNTAFDSARLMRIGNTVQIAIAGSLNDTDGIASWNGAIMTTIPVGYRPITETYLIFYCDGTNDQFRATATANVQTDGAVRINTRGTAFTPPTTGTHGYWISGCWLTADDFPTSNITG